MKLFSLFLTLLTIPCTAFSAVYQVNHDHSTIAFSGEHAGDAFDGTFKKWDASIAFDEETPENSAITITIDTASATTGNKMYDGTLPKSDWFAVEDYPTATFKSDHITKTDSGYHATGTLTIRDISHPIAFDFTLEDIAELNHSKKATASMIIDRLSYDIGKGSDGDAEWVSKDIGLTFELQATAQ